MQLVGVEYNPWPRLRLEYMCGGTLEDQGDISVDECVRILYPMPLSLGIPSRM